ncbi:uncharacterized protein KRP23_3718 [Phytophthora ramorum]|uniref:uncharacterized protein n=1 Tax=Phytophthora ramorum TaxID=164328 RepID=UPI00309B323D|nr:hypothetical protein KRP23_3718 [Phytophthora ramorum]
MTQLEVVLQNGIKMEYPNPVNHACFSIGECDEWHPAKLLLWWDLPANSVAMFFEDANCYSGEGFSMYTTDQGDADGEKVFENPQPIRSMMLGTNKDVASSLKIGSTDIAHGCWANSLIHRSILHHTFEPFWFENAAVDANETLQNATNQFDSDFDGNLSGNWSEALTPETAEGNFTG